jgi:hypothetical protein
MAGGSDRTIWGHRNLESGWNPHSKAATHGRNFRRHAYGTRPVRAARAVAASLPRTTCVLASSRPTPSRFLVFLALVDSPQYEFVSRHNASPVAFQVNSSTRTDVEEYILAHIAWQDS